MMSKGYKIALPLLFFGLIGFYWMDHYAHILPQMELQERRVLAKKPQLKLSFLDPFPKDYEAYYNDHFYWRNNLIRLNNYINYYTFKQSALPEKVLVGKAGWLFKAGFQLDIYRGKFQFTEQQLGQIAQELTRRKLIVEASGAKYYLTIPPQKHSIYPEYLPAGVKKLNEKTCTQQLIDYLQQKTDISYIDLFEPILEKKAQTDTLLYYQTDHHWNDITGLLAAQVILKRLRVDFPSIEPLSFNDYTFPYATFDGMTLAQMLGIDKELKESVPVLTPNIPMLARDSLRQYPAPHDFPFKDDYVIDKRMNRPDLPSLFVVRESFASATILPLAEHFSRSFFLFDNWRHQFNQPIFEQEQSAIYLQMVWEGLIFNLMENPPADAKW
ncbi:MAG: hypothetical protein R2828_01680 [Saprospiraceae bacterium]